jgi:hypothetical protein
MPAGVTMEPAMVVDMDRLLLPSGIGHVGDEGGASAPHALIIALYTTH